MKKFAFFSDLIFTFFLADICTLVLFRYLGVRFFPALFLAALCGGLTALAVGAILRYRRKNLYLKKSDEAQRQRLLLHLALLSDEQKTDYLQTALSTADTPINRFGKLRLFTSTEFYFLKFTPNPLSADEIPPLARLKTGKKKILLCDGVEENALDLCSRLQIEVKTGDWVYRKIKSANALPESYLGDESGAPKRSRRLKTCFARKNAKRFLVGGGLILLLSRMTPFYFYYLLMGCGLLFAAVFIRIFGYE